MKPWLAKSSALRRQQTAERIVSAIDSLVASGAPVSLANIQSEVSELYGQSVALSTIRRNPIAYEHYLVHAAHAKTRRKSQLPSRIASLKDDAAKSRFYYLTKLKKRELAEKLVIAEIALRRCGEESFNLRAAYLRLIEEHQQ